jgi:O-antigen ligase
LGGRAGSSSSVEVLLAIRVSARRQSLRLLALAGAGFSFLGVAFTFSRGAVVACVILLGVMVLLRIIRTRHFLAVVLAIGIVLLALPQYQARLNTLPQVLDVFTGSMTEETDGSLRGRTAEMLAAFLVFVDHPIVGVGPDMFQYYSQEYANPLGIRHLEESREAHSLPPDIAANHGILGLITFFGIFYITMRDLHELWRKLAQSHPRLSALCAGYMLALVAYLATGLFLHLSYVRYLWLMLALGAATAIIARRALEQDEKQLYQTPGVMYRVPRVSPPATGSTQTSS